MKIKREKIYRVNPDADPARLAHIVEVCNAHVAKGERCPICLGHTEGEGATEWLTVDIGDMDNFATDGEWVYSDWTIDDAFEEAVKRHRGKSVELWSDDLIYPLSLLAHNRPALELEPVKFSRDGEHQTYQTPFEEENDMDASATKNLIAECLQQSDLAAGLKALTEQVTQLSLQVKAHDEQATQLKWLFDENEEAAAEEAAEPASEAVAEDAAVEAGEHPELPSGEIEKIAEDHVAEGKGEEKPVEKDAMALPSGTNTFIPSTKVKDEEKSRKNYEELVATSKTYKDGLDATAARLAEMEAKYQMAQRRNDLILLAQRYQFDPDAEMKVVEGMTDAQFDVHKKTVVVRYAMPPVNRPPLAPVGELPKPQAEGEAPVIPQSEVLKVAKYCLKKIADGDKSYQGHEGWKKAAKELGIKV